MKTIKDICYSSIGHTSQKLDLYLPECEEFSVFIYFHGGGLEKGDKTDKRTEDMKTYLTDRNIALVSANYRMYPNAVYPEFILDAAAAVAWVFNNIGEYGKCDKIYVGGSSAGAYLSMMICFDKKWLAPYKISPSDISGYVHDAGQPTAHFNVLREKGIDSRRVIIDETAPIYYVGMAEVYSPMVFLVATNDMENRYEQNVLINSTMKHFGYDMSKVYFKYLEGTHCNYSDIKLAELVADFIKNN